MQRTKGLARLATLAWGCPSLHPAPAVGTGPWRAFGSIPAGHRSSDLSQHVCNVSLNRRRDITLRRDVTLSNAAGPQSLASLLKGHVSVIFGLPDMGSVCKDHACGYVEKAAALKEAGVDRVYCVAVGSLSKVEDFVGSVTAGSSTSAQGGIIEPLADESEAFMRMLGMNVINADKPQLKCHRFAALVDDGILIKLKVEESPGDIRVSSADSMVDFIEDMGSLRAAAAP